MKAFLPALLIIVTIACGGIRPVQIDFHLPAIQRNDATDDYFLQGWEQLQEGDSNAAYKSFQLSDVSMDKKQAAFGYVFLARRKFSAAADQFAAAMATNPDNIEAGMGMAMIHEFEGHAAEAYQAYGNLLVKAPEDAWIKLKYESIRSNATQEFLLEAENAKSTDKQKYIQALEKAAWFSPDVTSITLQIADYYYAENEWQRSLPYYEAVLEKDVHNEAVMLKLAALYEKKGKFDMALVTLDRLLELKPGDPFLESEKKRIREGIQEMNLPEKFKKIFFKTEINREELAALIGYYFEPFITIERSPEIITDIDGSFAREYIIKICTVGIMNARPDHSFDRFSNPDRATFAVILNALIQYLGQNGNRLNFNPLPSTSLATDLSPLHKNYELINYLLHAQVLPLDAENKFNPTRAVSPADVIYALKKILNSITE
ncbi:MAG: tetratricopeptide repeat protein [Candidatus Aminicenantes bacterium]|nr:tetratricopeptide repeat protein [Candidatus Aminicenantes bacterium]